MKLRLDCTRCLLAVIKWNLVAVHQYHYLITQKNKVMRKKRCHSERNTGCVHVQFTQVLVSLNPHVTRIFGVTYSSYQTTIYGYYSISLPTLLYLSTLYRMK